MNPSRTRPLSARRLIAQLHLWVGLALCVPLVLIGLTGSGLVLSDALRELSAPAPKAMAGAPHAIAEIIAAARAAAPAGYIPAFYGAPGAAGGLASVRLVPARNGSTFEAMQVQVDPVSLQVSAGARQSGWRRQLFLLHSTLLMRDRNGRQMVGWLGVAMLALGASGIVNWWPRPKRWRASFTVRRGAQGFALHRDLHGAIGIWTLAVFMIVSATGVYLAFPQSVGASLATLLQARDPRSAAMAIRVKPVPGVEPMTVDDAAALARGGLAEARLAMVGLPIRPDQPYRINLAPPGHADGTPMIGVFVDPWRRRIVETIDPRTFSAGETILAWMHPLHAGDGMGWIWKILVFLSGLLPLLFAVTGAAMWQMKRNGRRRNAGRRATRLQSPATGRTAHD